MSFLESAESKFSKLFLHDPNKNSSSSLFPDPIHYDYEQLYSAPQLKQMLNDTTSLIGQTRERLSQWFTGVDEDVPSVLGTGGEDALPDTPRDESGKQSGLSKLQRLFSSFRLKSSGPSIRLAEWAEGTPEPVLDAGCRASFPPTCPMFPYVRFWKKQFKSTDCHRSPLLQLRPQGRADPAGLHRYLVFQPDGGGWNNIRMAAETAMVFAMASGRTLVLPPNMTFYLLNKNGNAQLDTSSFENYFDLRKISELVHIITMPEFLERFEAMSSNNTLPNKETPQSLGKKSRGKLWNYLERTCFTRHDYHPGRMFFGFNISDDPLSANGVLFGSFSSDRRRKRMASHDRELVAYDSYYDSLPCIYFPGDYREKMRLLTHFYSYLYWARPAEERIYKRLVRDRLHYSDAIFCAAGRVVQLVLLDSHMIGSSFHATERDSIPSPCRGLRRVNQVDHWPGQSFETCHDRVTLGGDTRSGPTYFALHIRRGDFQYGHTRRSAEEIWSNVKHLLNASVTRLLYISTDEKNSSFFDPFREVFTVKFLDDYVEAAGLQPGHFNQNFMGMVEQVVCASAHTFVGTPLSTFTGYITRMRGYYRDGRYANTFYFLPAPMYQLHTKPELVGPFWAREFAVAHRDIDDDGFSAQSNVSGRHVDNT